MSKKLSGKKLRLCYPAFTLAEVLITLGIIGVVAALTIPGLINNYKAHKLHSQFLKSYSTIQQAMKLMLSEDLSTNPKDYANSVEYSKAFSRFLNAPLNCTNKTNLPCYPYGKAADDKKYKNLQGSGPTAYFTADAGQFAMQDGSLIMLDYPNLAAIGVTGSTVVIAADLNGYNNKPNKWGYDVFAFEFKDDEVIPVGDARSSWSDLDKYCSKNSTNRDNGFACAIKAKDNQDYFKELIKEFK